MLWGYVKQCWTCLYYNSLFVKEIGECRRYPPSFHPNVKEGDQYGVFMSPKVHETEYCGEFKFCGLREADLRERKRKKRDQILWPTKEG
jgi:hypothetical protein